MGKKDKSEKKESLFDRIRYKYRLSIYRDETYEEVLNLKLSRLNVIVIVGLLTIIFLAIVISIIVYTPAKELIPGYPNAETNRNIRLNNLRLDSLEKEIMKRDLFFDNIKKIVSGEAPDNFETISDTNNSLDKIYTYHSAVDSGIKGLMDRNEETNIQPSNNIDKGSALAKILFFAPVKGLVTNKFNATGNHYGIDVVAAPNEIVKAILDGTVIMATWTIETGNIIEIQHDNNLISVYKHNAELWKQQGDYVKAGDPIAIIGNSGELTTGPHLHFELWHNGTPVNPLDYISFK